MSREEKRRDTILYYVALHCIAWSSWMGILTRVIIDIIRTLSAVLAGMHGVC